MGNWFGDLNLAYKYTVVFLALLALTILAGLIKVFFDRRKLKKVTQKIKEEEEGREDQVELNHREKDEGDLFGVRAIEAGFFAGIPQSRPTSRAGSIAGSPSMSSSTLIGGFNSSKLNSMASSVTDLPLAHTNNRDSDVLPSTSPPRRMSPPALKLAPSEAEMTGRHNHNASVNMGLTVPPSPVFARHDSDGRTSPVSGAQNAVLTSSGNAAKSQSASIMSASPDNSCPPSPGEFRAMAQSTPAKDNTNSPYAAYAPAAQSESSIPSGPTIVLPPTTSEPSHQRDPSDGSSIYSVKRNSKHMSMNNRQSVANGSFLAPISSNDNSKDVNDPRFSEFYDAYFRNSQFLKDAPKRPDLLSTEPAIAEDESPLSLPAHAK
ncbi:hypothetical protein DM02DRAFT_609981 [Periconia macrospinosa]|uniref:Uncharacterized protein n=1 Tax=Periconia macrospinosa TaxID=97972 RepID=A0A2V1E7R2_9PLEO|nr:hypothetical protein DM02DRAFT_609981 [Periconia macrospinosa]